MSVTVNTRIRRMGRWEPDSRGRLQEAALALFSERGFDQTTAAQIAARAGVTERTFFRHFADKREVLFGGSVLLGERIIEGVEEARRIYREALADGRPVIVCANHLTMVDSIYLHHAFASIADYLVSFRRFSWNVPAVENFKRNLLLRSIGIVLPT